MKNRLRYVASICFVFILTSSFAKDDPVLSTFPKAIDIKCEISSINSDDLGEVVDFLVFDSIVIVSEMFQPYLFKYFDKMTGLKQADFICKGNGPNELNNPGVLEKHDDSIFVTFDANKKDLVYLNSNDIFHKEYIFYKVVDFENPDLIIFKVYPLSESVFLCTGVFEDGAYCIYNIESKEYKVSIKFPVEEKHKKDDYFIKSMANQGQIVLNPEKNKFVFASGRGYIDFCEINNADIKLTKRNFYFSPEYKVIAELKTAGFTSESVFGFMDVLATEKYIYALYSGRTFDEEGTGTYEANDILVYDWEGNPIANYKTDRFIRNIAFDEKNLFFMVTA